MIDIEIVIVFLTKHSLIGNLYYVAAHFVNFTVTDFTPFFVIHFTFLITWTLVYPETHIGIAIYSIGTKASNGGSVTNTPNRFILVCNFMIRMMDY